MAEKYEGGWLKPGQTVAHNTSGKPEPVLTDEQRRKLREKK